MKNDCTLPDSQPSRTNVISSTVVRLKAKRIKYLTPDEVPACGPRFATRRPAKVAQMLALAHHIQRVVDGGRALDRTVAASRLGLTKARLTQLLDLTLLAPDVQEAILRLEAIDGVEPMSERRLRTVASKGDWRKQREVWRREFAALDFSQ